MITKIYLLIILHMAVFSAFAQKYEHLNVQRTAALNRMEDTQEYLEYTIRLTHAKPAQQRMFGYGLEILKNNKPLVKRFQHLLPFSPDGILKKDDAYKIAQWMIREYKNTGHWPNIVPPHIAHELTIETR